MFIHRENALKAHQHISYCPIQRYHLKKTTFLIQKLIKISSRRIKLHIFSKFSRRVACPLACVQLISLFLFLFIYSSSEEETHPHSR